MFWLSYTAIVNLMENEHIFSIMKLPLENKWLVKDEHKYKHMGW